MLGWVKAQAEANEKFIIGSQKKPCIFWVLSLLLKFKNVVKENVVMKTNVASSTECKRN